MALDKNKLITESVQTPAAATPAATTSSAASATSPKSQPVSLKQEEKKDPLTEAIKNEDFQQLSEEEQLKRLKKLFPNVDEEVLKTTLNTVKTTIQTETKAAAPSTEGSAATPSAPQTEEEAMTEVYAQALGEGVTIDDVIASIKQKDPEKLTETEKAILAYVNANHSGNIQDAFGDLKQILEKHGDNLDKLIANVAQNTPNWDKKTPAEKLALKSDALLSQIIPNYDKLNDVQKTAARENFYDKIGTAIIPNWDKLEKEDKMVAKTTFAVAVDLAEKKGVPLKDLLDGKSMQEITKDAMLSLSEQALSNIKFDTTSKDWITKTPEEQVNTIIDSTIESLDPDYKTKFSKEKQAEIREKIIEDFGQKIYGKEVWNNFSDKEKELKLQSIATKMSAVKASGLTLKEFFAMEPKDRLVIIEAYERKINHKPGYQEQIRRDVIKELNKDEVTDADVRNYIQKRLKNGKLTKQERSFYQRELQRIKDAEEKFGVKAETRVRVDESETLKYRADVAYGGDMKKMVEKEILKGQSIEEYRRTHSLNDIKDLLEMTGDLKAQHELCKIFKLSPAEKQALIEDGVIVDFMTKANVDKNLEGLDIANQVAHDCKRVKLIKTGTELVKETHKDDVEFNTKYDIALSKIDAKYTVYSAESNNKYLSEANALKVSENFNRSNEVSNAAKATYTKAVVETAKTPAMQVKYAQTLSQIDNPAVIEGLAAASKNVDKSVQSQYNKTVTTAAERYPEQKAAIMSAMKTGQISSATLSQTTPSADSSNTSSSNNSSNSTNNNSQQSAAVNNQQTAASSSVKGTTQNSANVQANKASTATTTATASSSLTTSTNSASQVDTSQQVRQSEIKKQAALENVEQVKENIDKSIKEWEDKHRPLSSEEKDALKTQAAVEAAATAIEESSNSDSEKERVLEELSKASSIGEVYDILVNALGSKVHDKFIEVLASYGSTDNIRSFVNSRAGDIDIVKELYLKCKSTTLKSELLNLLPDSTVMEMLEKRYINTLDSVDHRILFAFLSKNVYSMSMSTLKTYLPYLPGDEREKIVKMRNTSHGIEQTAQQNAAQAQTMAASMSLSQEQPLFAQGETRKVRNDGTVITNQGTSFGAVSNTSFDQAFNVVPQETENQKVGKIDNVYTKGTTEYNLAHNNYDQTPTTAFTMQDMYKDDFYTFEDTGSGINPPRMANWKRGKRWKV
ncbi:hypothetical protein IJ541_10150 [bacterium]|nr:hypothetical protein [bacterium]